VGQGFRREIRRSAGLTFAAVPRKKEGTGPATEAAEMKNGIGEGAEGGGGGAKKAGERGGREEEEEEEEEEEGTGGEGSGEMRGN